MSGERLYLDGDKVVGVLEKTDKLTEELRAASKKRNEVIDLFMKTFVVTHYEGKTAEELAKHLTGTMAIHHSMDMSGSTITDKYWLDLRPETTERLEKLVEIYEQALKLIEISVPDALCPSPDDDDEKWFVLNKYRRKIAREALEAGEKIRGEK